MVTLIYLFSFFPYILVFAELATSEVRIGSSIDLRMIDAPHPFYECIAPLRGLLLKEMDPEKWATIQVWHEPTMYIVYYTSTPISFSLLIYKYVQLQ